MNALLTELKKTVEVKNKSEFIATYTHSKKYFNQITDLSVLEEINAIYRDALYTFWNKEVNSEK
jgi:hypothetical protein